MPDIHRAREIARTAYSHVKHVFQGVDGAPQAVDMAASWLPEKIVAEAMAGNRVAYLAGQLLVTRALVSDEHEHPSIVEFSRYAFGRCPPPKGKKGDQARKLNSQEQAKYIYEVASLIADEAKLSISANDATETESALNIISQEFGLSLSTTNRRYEAGRKLHSKQG